MFSTDLICLHVQARSLLFDVQHLVKRTVKFVPAFFNSFNKPTEEVLRDSTPVVFIPISLHCYCHGIWETLFFVAVSTGKRISYSRISITRTPRQLELNFLSFDKKRH